MKQKYTLIALLGLIGTSCSNQDLEEKYTDVGQVQVIADIAKSRVSFNESNGTTYAYWQTGDAITLSTPTQENLNYTATVSEDDATVATFAPEAESLKDIDGESIYACYPATTITDGIVALPATDEWTDAKPLPFAYAVSSITDSKVNLTFEHTFAFLKLTLDSRPLANVTSTDGDKTVHSLLIKSATESLGVASGSFNFEDKSVNIIEGSNEVKFILGTAFNPSEETERSIYIPILPQSSDVAMTISLLHDYDGGQDILLTMDKQTPTDGFVAGHVYTLALIGNSSAVIEGESGEIHLAEAGTLSNYITEENKYTIKSLKLSGYLNGDDIILLREMAGDKGILTDLDVEEASIVEGGRYYCYNYSRPQYTSNNIWGAYFFMDSKLKNVILPKNITAIMEHAFEDCFSLENIEIPEGVTWLGGACFRNSALKNITLPESLKTIAEYAFYGCKSLTEISIQDNVEEIQTYAFYQCSSLKNVSLGKGVTTIGDYAFTDCTSLSSLAIPNGSALKSIGNGAFGNCSSMMSFTIDSNAVLTSIGDKAFSNCDYLTSLTIPDGVAVSLGTEAFTGCDALASVTLGNSVVSIGNSAFNSCKSLGVVTIGESVKKIGDNAFHYCDALGSVILSEGLETIGNSAFAGCESLMQISIPESVTTIDDYAFNGCNRLKSITIPDAVTNMGEGAFLSCSAMETLILGKGLTIINKKAFMNCSSLKSVTILDQITEIETQAFEGCKAMEDLSLGQGITSIEWCAFRGCKSLKSDIVLPDGLEFLGPAAFYECFSLPSISNVILGQDEIFYNCNSLKKVTINDKSTKIGRGTFRYCYALQDIVLPEGIVEIQRDAFASCELLKCINIPDGVILIGTGAFAFTGLTNVTIPDKLSIIDESVFFNCESLSKVIIGKGIVSIEELNFIINTGGKYAPITEFVCKPVVPPVLKDSRTFINPDAVADTKLYVPKGSLAAYQESDWATHFGNIIEMEE